MIHESFSPASSTIAGMPGSVLFLLVALVGIGIFAWVMARRMVPLFRAETDPRLNRIPERVVRVLKYWLAQWRQPRYMLAGVLH
ncbi:MAG: electron transfer flavoprotein, partial [Thermoanaerobaculia bacterium]|nr:electron transfer flavoprotein [Thermoanaerobaculia bacterium]